MDTCRRTSNLLAQHCIAGSMSRKAGLLKSSCATLALLGEACHRASHPRARGGKTGERGVGGTTGVHCLLFAKSCSRSPHTAKQPPSMWQPCIWHAARKGVYPHWFRVASRSMLQAPATNQWCFAEARTFRSWDGLGTAVKLVEDMSPRGRGVSWDQGAWLMSQLALLPGTTGHAACFPTFVIFLMSGLPISAFACASFYACTH